MFKPGRAALLLCLFFCASTSFAQRPLSIEEKNFVDLLNEYRSSMGLDEIDIHPALQAAAQSHSEWMSQVGKLTHNGPLPTTTFDQRIFSAGFGNYTQLAENVACGYPDAQRTFQQWINSPPHLKNILNPNFHFMGIARAGNSSQPCPFFWTNDFAGTKNGMNSF